MTHRFTLQLHTGNGIAAETECLAVTLEREAYLPYAQMTAVFLSDGKEHSNVTAISLLHEEQEVFFGMTDSVHRYWKNGRAFVRVTSRSFTSVLAQNELVPGMHYDMTMQKLMTGFYSFPHVQYEDYAGTGYIYVKDGSSMWDSIINFCYKLSGRHPFIHGSTVRLTPHPNAKNIVLPSDRVLEYGMEEDTTKLISMYHMADLGGNYDAYQLENPVAAAAQIVRHKQLLLDQQYLSEPENALLFRSLFSQRGCKARYLVYNGFGNEEITDKVSFGEFLTNAMICRVRMSFDGNGVKTKLWAYDDGFYHID